MKRNYWVNYATKTITITKEFQDKASNITSDEYNIIGILRKDLPGFRVCVKPACKRKSANGRLTYDRMVKYLSCQPNAPVLLNMFANVREQSKAQSNPYLYVKEWFLNYYPDYTAFPQFDESGNMVSREVPPVAACERKTA